MIGVDIRCLASPARSGVGEYTSKILDALFRLDGQNNYFLFYNSWRNTQTYLPAWNYKNIYFGKFRYPNKLFNLSLKFLRQPQIDKLLFKFFKLDKDAPKIETFFIPNLNFFSFSSRCKKILVVHDLSFEICPDFFSKKQRLLYKLLVPRKTIKRCDKIVAVSENTKQDLIQVYDIPEEKITVIYPGAGAVSGSRQQTIYESKNFSSKDFQTPFTAHDRLPPKFILYLGTIEPRKNLVGLIRAFECLAKSYQSTNTNPEQNYYLIIAGGFGYRAEEVWSAARTSSAAKQIKFLGYVSGEVRSALYASASLFIYPSFYEGFGFPPLEAQTFGVPVAASFSSSLGEVLGNSALLFNPDKIDEMTEAMHQCLTDKTLRANLIKRGYENIKRFSWEESARKVLVLLNR